MSDNRTNSWIALLALIVIAGTALLVLLIIAPAELEGPCLEKVWPRGPTAIECAHSEHVMMEYDKTVRCHCDDAALTDGGEG